jgi:hypothetical protein
MGGQGSKDGSASGQSQTVPATAGSPDALVEQASGVGPLPGLVPVEGGAEVGLSAATAEELLSTTASAAHAMRNMRHSASRVGFASATSMSDLLAQPNRLEDAKLALKKVRSKDDMLGEFHARELAAAAFKSERALDWCVARSLPPLRQQQAVC